MGLGTGALHNGVDHYRCNAFRIIKSRESNSLTLIASFKVLQPLLASNRSRRGMCGW